MIYELIFAGTLFFNPQVQKDSLGTETVNGKLFVIHKVDEKETLYALSRRYGAPVDAILKSNPGLSTTLEVGQIVKVPYEKKTVVKTTTTTATHKVAAKETMYSIARTYGISVEDLKKWNNITDNNISIGQDLIVKKPSGNRTTPVVENTTKPIPASGIHTVATGETLYAVSRQYGITVAQLRSWNTLSSDELKSGQDIFVAAPGQRKENNVQTQPQAKKESTPVRAENPPVEPVKNDRPETAKSGQTPTPQPQTRTETIRISESMKNSDEIMESGLAELIEGTEGNRKYLALHRTAPVGTILKVRNEMNNREVFVRVMGKLPETPVNDKLVLKISRSAYDRLGAIDARFRVELTYYK